MIIKLNLGKNGTIKSQILLLKKISYRSFDLLVGIPLFYIIMIIIAIIIIIVVIILA